MNRNTSNKLRKSPFGKALRLSLIFLVAFSLSGFCNFSATAGPLKFASRERLVYQAKWGFLNAGETVIETLPPESVNGVRVLHFVMTTRTSDGLDPFYMVRERQDSYVDEKFTHSVQYEKKAAGKHPRDIVVYFNWRQRQATHSNFGELNKPIAIAAGTFDPLSMFFAIRRSDFREGSAIEVTITDGKKLIPVKVRISGREKITINQVVVDTFVVEPDFDLKQAFNSDVPRLKIWFSADEKRIPVKIQSKVKVGTFDLELVSASL